MTSSYQLPPYERRSGPAPPVPERRTSVRPSDPGRGSRPPPRHHRRHELYSPENLMQNAVPMSAQAAAPMSAQNAVPTSAQNSVPMSALHRNRSEFSRPHSPDWNQGGQNSADYQSYEAALRLYQTQHANLYKCGGPRMTVTCCNPPPTHPPPPPEEPCLMSHPTPPPEAFIQNRDKGLTYSLSGVTIMTNSGKAYTMEESDLTYGGSPPIFCWRDIINIASCVLVGVGGPVLFAVRGMIGSDGTYLVVPSIGLALGLAFGTYRTFAAGCEPDDAVLVASTGFFFGYFGAHWLHYQGNNWYPEAIMSALGALLLTRILFKTLGLWPISF